MEEEEKEKDPLVTWSGLLAEADSYLRRGMFHDAESLYNKALELSHANTHVLTCRSHCRLLLGDLKGAESDADAILNLNSKSIKGILCKAESQFAQGDFENAMIWYSNGLKIKPDLYEFENGAARCREAIEKAVKYFDVDKIKKVNANKYKSKLSNADKLKTATINKLDSPPEKGHGAQVLLEEIYVDYLFLKELESDPIFDYHQDCQDEIQNTVGNLDKLVEFLRAKNPKAVHESSGLDSNMRTNSKILRNMHNVKTLNKRRIVPKIN